MPDEVEPTEGEPQPEAEPTSEPPAEEAQPAGEESVSSDPNAKEPSTVLPGEPGPDDPQPGTEPAETEPEVTEPEVTEPEAPPAEPNPATDAGNEKAPSGAQPVEPPKKDIKVQFDDLINAGKAAVAKSLQQLAKDLLKQGRTTIGALIKSSELSYEKKKTLSLVYKSAETHAVAGRAVQADAMVRRAMNFVRSDALVKKAIKFEATENYLATVLSLLSSAGLGFLNTFGKPLAADATALAGDVLDDIFRS